MTQEEFFYQCIDIIEHWHNLYNEVTKPHWISVDDELPKEDGTYLFYNAESQGVYVSDFWADITLNENISHWMRIKKPGESVTTCNHKTSSSSEIPTNLKGGEK